MPHVGLDFVERLRSGHSSKPSRRGTRPRPGGARAPIPKHNKLLHPLHLQQGTSAVVLGWTPESRGSSSAVYAIRFSAGGASFDRASRLTFFLSGSTERPDRKDATEGPREVPRVEVEIEDLDGSESRVDVSELAPIAMPLEVQFLKWAWLNREAHGRKWEPTLASYEIPFEALLARNPQVDVARLAVVRFLLASEEGSVIVLDDVGIASFVENGEGKDRPEGDEGH